MSRSRYQHHSSARRLAAAAALIAALAGCAGNQEPAYVEKPVDQLYNQAMDDLAQSKTVAAAGGFDEVERQHPYSVWATKAQLMAAYAHYEGSRYPQAIIALDRFIQLHPGNPDVAYAYYLKALSYYEQITDVARDQKITEQALAALEDVAKRFPNTSYARDSQIKIDLARDHLAGKEMEIGRYYQNQGQHLAAINRYRKVIEEYQTTSHTPEALHRLSEGYAALGLTDEAQKTAAVLGHNYPGSEWYADSYYLVEGKDMRPNPPRRSWLARGFDWLF